MLNLSPVDPHLEARIALHLNKKEKRHYNRRPLQKLSTRIQERLGAQFRSKRYLQKLDDKPQTKESGSYNTKKEEIDISSKLSGD